MGCEMKKISPDEKAMLGSVMREGKMLIDREACLRINWLASEVLENVGVGKESGGWEKLYRDPADGRYWLLTYPHGEMQGGGPPLLPGAEHLSASSFSTAPSPPRRTAVRCRCRAQRLGLSWRVTSGRRTYRVD